MQGFGYNRVDMPQIANRNPGEKVEVLLSPLIPDLCSFAPYQGYRIPAISLKNIFVGDPYNILHNTIASQDLLPQTDCCTGLLFYYLCPDAAIGKQLKQDGVLYAPVNDVRFSHAVVQGCEAALHLWYHAAADYL